MSDKQNCGNILAGVAPFAIEQGLVRGCDPVTKVRIFMVNTSQTVVATVQTPGGKPEYQGNARIDGVPGTAAPIPLSFSDTAGSTCGALLPTGRTVDVINGVEVTCIDNGMPVVVMRASDVGRTGYETREELDKDTELKARIEAIRLTAGPMMNLGDVKDQTVPKMILLAPPREGGVVSTRSFIPHRAHAAIGVFAAVSVATACLLPESPAHSVARIPDGTTKLMLVEHPTGASPVSLTTEKQDGKTIVSEAAIISTARALFEGHVLVPDRPEQPGSLRYRGREAGPITAIRSMRSAASFAHIESRRSRLSRRSRSNLQPEGTLRRQTTSWCQSGEERCDANLSPVSSCLS